MGDVVWKSSLCENSTTDNQNRKRKLFERYVNDIICTVKDHPKKLASTRKQFVKKIRLQKKIEEKYDLVFLDMAVYVTKKSLLKTVPNTTDSGTILNLRSRAPDLHTRYIVEGTIHRFF